MKYFVTFECKFVVEKVCQKHQQIDFHAKNDFVTNILINRVHFQRIYLAEQLEHIKVLRSCYLTKMFKVNTEI